MVGRSRFLYHKRAFLPLCLLNLLMCFFGSFGHVAPSNDGAATLHVDSERPKTLVRKNGGAMDKTVLALEADGQTHPISKLQYKENDKGIDDKDSSRSGSEGPGAFADLRSRAQCDVRCGHWCIVGNCVGLDDNPPRNHMCLLSPYYPYNYTSKDGDCMAYVNCEHMGPLYAEEWDVNEGDKFVVDAGKWIFTSGTGGPNGQYADTILWVPNKKTTTPRKGWKICRDPHPQSLFFSTHKPLPDWLKPFSRSTTAVPPSKPQPPCPTPPPTPMPATTTWIWPTPAP